MEIKSLAVSTIDLDALEEGVIKGLIAVYGNRDSGGDRLVAGCFRKSIAERGQTIPLGWQHDLTEPLGRWEVLKEVGRAELPPQVLAIAPDATGGLWGEGRISRTQKNLDRMISVKDGTVPGLSIGYEPIQQVFVKDAGGDRTRELKECRLWEGSAVTIGMNPAALVTYAKGAQNSELKAVAYADPDNEAWPIDDADHVHAALSYYNAGKGESGHSDAEWAQVGKRIATAASRVYDKPYHLTDGKVSADDATKHAATPARKADTPDAGIPVSDKGTHGAFTGSHAHPHQAYDDQGDDATHAHRHSHSEDASHAPGEGHAHAEKSWAIVERKWEHVTTHEAYNRLASREKLALLHDLEAVGLI